MASLRVTFADLSGHHLNLTEVLRGVEGGWPLLPTSFLDL